MKNLIIDSDNFFWIAKYRVGEDPSEYDLEQGIIFHFLDIVFEIAETLKTSKISFVFDSRKSKRKEFYPEYKAHRHTDMSDQEREELNRFYKQHHLLREEILPKLGFNNIYQQEYYEGDDLIASIVDNNKEKFWVVSADQDMYQLLNKCNVYHYKKRELVTKNSFKKKYGIDPDLWVNVKCYAGESKTNDNIKGVEGVGEKTALAYVKGELPEFTKAKKPTKAYAAISSDEAQTQFDLNMTVVKIPLEGTMICKYKRDEIFTMSDFLDIFNKYNLTFFTTQKELRRLKQLFELKGLNDFS